MTEPDKLIGAFYLDCFTEGNLPVNSYGPASFARCLKEAGKLRAISGVTRITIAPETLGQCPMPIGDSYKHQDPG